LIPGIKTYKWSPTGTGEVMGVRHAGDLKWSQMPPRGMAFCESLNKVVQSEPVMERDRLIFAQLRFLGIEKGKPFKPDERQKKILEEAAVMIVQRIRVLSTVTSKSYLISKTLPPTRIHLRNSRSLGGDFRQEMFELSLSAV